MILKGEMEVNMFNSKFKKIAKRLGLKDLGKVKAGTVVGPAVCPDCDTPLRLGEEIVDKFSEPKVAKGKFTYCWKCVKTVFFVSIARFPPATIKVAPHND